MTQSDPLDGLRNTLKGLRDEGQADVRIDDLLEVLGNLPSLTTVQLETWKEKCRRERLQYQATVTSARLQYQATIRQQTEMFRSVITAGQAALKSAILINGGASVAVLALVGSLVQHGTPVGRFGAALLCFAVGALLGAMAAGGTYLAQGNYADGNTRRGDHWGAATILVVIFCYVVFLGGCVIAYSAI